MVKDNSIVEILNLSDLCRCDLDFRYSLLQERFMPAATRGPPPYSTNESESAQKDVLWSFNEAKQNFESIQREVATFSAAYGHLSKLLIDNPGSITVADWQKVLCSESLDALLAQYNSAQIWLHQEEAKAIRLGCILR